MPPTSAITPNIAIKLAEIEAKVGNVAATNDPGSDLHELAYAMHRLIDCIRELHRPAQSSP